MHVCMYSDCYFNEERDNCVYVDVWNKILSILGNDDDDDDDAVIMMISIISINLHLTSV